jgi:hypothetical protein
MLTKSGAKLVDFGLAKTAAPAVTTSGLSMAPTTPYCVAGEVFFTYSAICWAVANHTPGFAFM